MQLVDNELSEPYSIFTYRWGPCCCAGSRAYEVSGFSPTVAAPGLR